VGQLARPHSMTYRFEHFVATYDQEWDYKAIAEDMFNGPRVLVTEEHLNSNHHVHFQGETSLHETTFSDKMGELAKTHHERKRRPGCRPVHRDRKPVDEKGFQYQMKEGHPPLYVRGFTEEELEELATKAKEVFEEHKEGVYNHLLTAKVPGDMEPKKVALGMFIEARKWLKERDRKISRHTKMDVLNAMMDHPSSKLAWQQYVWDHL